MATAEIRSSNRNLATLALVVCGVLGCTPPAPPQPQAQVPARPTAEAPASAPGVFVVEPVSPDASAAPAAAPPPIDTQERPTMDAAGLEPMIHVALADAAKRSGVDPAQLKLVSAERVTWPNGSIGCPRPGMMYTQALVPGYRIRIQAGAEVLDYHGAQNREPAFCPADRARGAPRANPRS